MKKLTALQQATLWELRQALEREKLPTEHVSELDRHYTPNYWLEQCVKVYGLGNNPGVKRLYEERFKRPVPEEYQI